MDLAGEMRGNIPAIIRNDDNLYEGNLVSYFRNVFSHAENLYNPYHNFGHLFHVVWLCHKACIFYSGSMPKREMRILLIAAMFHDFNHTGTAGPDGINIARAVAGLKKYIAPEDKDEFHSIAKIIRGTQYPDPVPADERTFLSWIISDADAAQVLNPVWIQRVIFGLAAEWNKTPFEILETQLAFLRKLRFRTVWGREIFPPSAVNEKITETQGLIGLLQKESPVEK